jgi:Skp family chaperone for outer membrane proteins
VLIVTKSVSGAAFAAAVLVLSVVLTTAASAQQPGARPAPVAGIAMVDLGRVFKEYGRFNAQMEAMKAEVQTAEATMKKENDYLNSRIEELKQLKPGSQEYNTLEQEIARLRGDMGVRVQLKRKEFVMREAKIYHQAYDEISQVVRDFAQGNNISAVFRYNGDQVNTDNPEEVLRDLNKPVVFFSPGMDITGYVLQALNGGARQPGGNVPAAADQRNFPPSRGGIPAPQRR